jgi:DNA polymerase V
VPKHAHGTANLGKYTSSTKQIMAATMELFDRIVDPELLTRRVTVVANHVVDQSLAPRREPMEQLDLFTDYTALKAQQEAEDAALERERQIQETMLTIKREFGKNAILKGMNLEKGATTMERNRQVGGHRA